MEGGGGGGRVYLRGISHGFPEELRGNQLSPTEYEEGL